MITKTKIAFLAIAVICCAAFAQTKSAPPSEKPEKAGQAKSAKADKSDPSAKPAHSGEAKREPVKTTVDDRKSVEVTIYNRSGRSAGTGLVKETRKVTLPAGPGELQFMDVAARINPVTVHIKPLSNAADFFVLEQNYEYDLISHSKLMDKYIGKDIKLIDRNDYQDTRRTVDAVLLSMNGGEVYKIDNEIYLGHPGIKVLPEIPGNLISRPTLSWIYRNRIAREYELEVTYMTGGMGWSADYVLLADEAKESACGLSGWVTLENESGASFEDAKLTLVAGSTSDGLYIYDLGRPATAKQNQKKQVSLMEAQGLKIEKEYFVSPSSNWRSKVDGAAKQTVNTFFKFKNSKANKLGEPLPGGVVRMYTADVNGSQQFIGEDRISHIPRDEELRLKVGEAFDIVAERTQVNYKQITTRSSETEWKLSVRNRKSGEDVTVRLEEQVPGEWEIRESSHKYEKVDAKTFRFDVPVKHGQEVVVTYKIRASW
ncbi:MAG: DUF4139 domain-containing protein [Chitinispirillia bacterium]|nr:DUF4139 domain-containing protein [Chitinispirillia bacterium]MCL2241948.1 DUF4139 domain-containing protein [Chitinispirillia bacterium]